MVAANSLYVLDINDFSKIRQFDAQIAEPHNLMINSAADKLFVTHSDPDAVTVYDILPDGGLDEKKGRILFEEDGSVPFGIMNLVSLSEFRGLNGNLDDLFDGDGDDEELNFGLRYAMFCLTYINQRFYILYIIFL